MEDKEFSFEDFEQEFNESWEEDDTNDESTDEVVEDSFEEEVEEDSSEDETETQVGEEAPPIHDEDVQKRNRAFAEIRKQAQDNQKYADFIQQLAEQNGVTPQEIMQRFEDRKLEQRAEQEGVPVDVLKRLDTLESRNQQLEEQTLAEKFNSEVDRVVSENNLSNEEVQRVFQFMHEKGYVQDNRPTIPFEDAFFLSNKDTIIQREIERTRQQELSDKRKRQTSSAIPSGNSVSTTDDIDAEVDKYIKESVQWF